MEKIMISVQNNLSIFNNLYRFLTEETATTTTMDVKAEKDVAMRRFNRRRKLKWLFEATAVLFVLAQSSTFWLPIAADLLRETVSVFRSHLFVFALFNSIILAVYALSARIPRPPSNDDASTPSAAAESGKTDLYDEFVTKSNTTRTIPAAKDSTPLPETDLSENACEERPGGSDCTDGGEISERALVVVMPHGNHQRTRSESFQMKTRIGEESQRDFRRSYTDIRRKLTPCGGEELAARKSNAVNRMSDEEFNRRIEDFIANQKWVQQEEYKEERKTERFNMALTTTVCQ